MSEQQGLFYEMSLTNRQVAVGILTLLFCVFGAFVAGVWVGREAFSADATTVVAAAERPNMESYQFFGGPQDAAPPAKVAATTTSLPAPPAEPAAAPAPADDGDLAEPVAAPTRPAATTQATTSARPATTSVAAAPAPAPANAGGAPDALVIQVFSSHDEAQAKQVAERLRNAGFKGFMSPVPVGGRTMFRVRVGPFGERAVAEAEAARVRRELRLETWVTSAAN